MNKTKSRKTCFNSITFRLIAAFLIIVLPLQITAYLIFSWSSRQLRSGIQQETIANAAFLQSRIDTELNYILQTITYLLNDTTVTSLAYQQESSQTAEHFTLLREIQNRLLLLRDSNILLQDIAIHFNRNQKVLTYKDYTYEDQADYTALVDQLRGRQAFYTIIDNELSIADMYPTKNRYSDKYPDYLVRASLSAEALSRYLSDFSDIRQKSIALYQTSSGYCLYGQANLLDHDVLRSIVQTIGQPDKNNTAQIKTISISGGTYYTVTYYLPLIDCLLVQAVPITQITDRQKQYQTFLTVFTILSLLLFLGYAIMTQRLVHKPVKKLISGFYAIGSGQYDVKISLPHPANEFRDLIDNFNRMAAKLDEAVNKLFLQELYVKQIELKQLQMQINPHFLYNSYFMLSRLVAQEDLESAKKLAEHLGEYFQFITRNDSDRVPLEQEWRHTRSYLDIQAIRFERRIVFDIAEVPTAYRDYSVPRLILQPIVENALEHGLKHKMQDGLLRLAFKIDSAGLQVLVEDNGDEMTPEILVNLQNKLAPAAQSPEMTTALINIHRRLQLAYGLEYGVTLRRRQEGGLQVILNLPPATGQIEPEVSDVPDRTAELPGGGEV